MNKVFEKLKVISSRVVHATPWRMGAVVV